MAINKDITFHFLISKEGGSLLWLRERADIEQKDLVQIEKDKYVVLKSTKDSSWLSTTATENCSN